MNVIIRTPQTAEEWDNYYAVRYRTLRKPWNQPQGSERDDEEEQAVHAAAFAGNQIVGVARLQFLSAGKGQIRYMGVLPGFGKMGIGSKLLQYLETLAKEQGCAAIVLNARDYALPFYEKNGYRIKEKSYLLWGEIQHYLMEKTL